MMEDEAAFPVDAQLQERPVTSSYDSTQSTATDSAKDTVRLHVHERTPLLSQTSDHEGSESSDQKTAARWKSRWEIWRQPSVFWLFPFLLLYMLGYAGAAVPKINLVLSLVCRDYLAEKASQDPNFTYLPVVIGGDNRQCQVPEVQSLVAQFQLYLNLIPGILSALVSPRFGQLSDRYGRTKLIALSSLGAVLGEIITVLVAAKPDYLPLNLLLVGAMLDGIGGSLTTIMALSTSYASDCTVAEKRGVAFGYLYGALFIGTAAGPLLAALVLKKTGQMLIIFVACLALHALFFLVITFVIPESLSKERQQVAREKHGMEFDSKENSSWLSSSVLQNLNPKNLITPLSILFPPVGRPSALFPNRRGASPALRRNIVLLAGLDTITFGVSLGTAQILIIYAEYMFNWGNVESSLFISIASIIRVLNLFIVYPIITRMFHVTPSQQHIVPGSSTFELVIIRVSILLDFLGYVGYALATHSSLMVLSGVITALGGMGTPTLQSSLTKHVPRDRIGQILGAKGLLNALARVIAPTVCNLIYSMTVGKYSQTVFVSLAAVFGLAFCCTFYVQPHVFLDDSRPSSPNLEANEDGELVDDPLLNS